MNGNSTHELFVVGNNSYLFGDGSTLSYQRGYVESIDFGGVKLQSNFNNIIVRSFILSGAPTEIKMGTGITGKFCLRATESPTLSGLCGLAVSTSQVLCFTQFQAKSFNQSSSAAGCRALRHAAVNVDEPAAFILHVADPAGDWLPGRASPIGAGHLFLRADHELELSRLPVCSGIFSVACRTTIEGTSSSAVPPW
jgi:hypothetical protein